MTFRTLGLMEELVRAVEALGGSPWKTDDPFLFCAYHLDAYPQGDEAMGPAVPLEGRQLGRDFSGQEGWSMYHGHQIPGFPRHPKGYRQRFPPSAPHIARQQLAAAKSPQALTAGMAAVLPGCVRPGEPRRTRKHPA